MRILVTGGMGFIGSHFVRLVLRERPDWHVTNLDKLTYAGNPANLADVADAPQYRFVRGDICDRASVAPLIGEADAVINFAAETHVDRSLLGAEEFLRTDVLGVFTLLEEGRQAKVGRFVQVSTDEVYGSIPSGQAGEASPLSPSNPYAASKASADLLVLSYSRAYEVPVVIVRSSNNFGPNQYPEKLIPFFATQALERLPLPLYGDGLQVRDWLYMEDNCAALLLALEKGQPGEVYNVSAHNERTNLEIAQRILRHFDRPPSLLRHVADRPSHDRRYALDSSRIRALGWEPKRSFEQALSHTLEWYEKRRDWWEPIKSGEYLEYYKAQYGWRLEQAVGEEQMTNDKMTK